MPGTESKDNKLWDKKLGKPDACRVFYCIITAYFAILFLAYTIIYEIIQQTAIPSTKVLLLYPAIRLINKSPYKRKEKIKFTSTPSDSACSLRL